MDFALERSWFFPYAPFSYRIHSAGSKTATSATRGAKDESNLSKIFSRFGRARFSNHLLYYKMETKTLPFSVKMLLGGSDNDSADAHLGKNDTVSI